MKKAETHLIISKRDAGLIALGAAAGLFFAAMLTSGRACAQQSAPDSGVAVSRQLWIEANDRIVALSIENARLVTALKGAQDELAKLKEKPAESPKP